MRPTQKKPYGLLSMGADKIRHLLVKNLAGGKPGYFWNPSNTLRKLGAVPEALGQNEATANARAIELNNFWDEVRRGSKSGTLERPDSIRRLIKAYESSDEFSEKRSRTQADYTYYNGKIDDEFGPLPVGSITPKVFKLFYRRLKKEKSLTWAYHVAGQFRNLMKWAKSEDWITIDPTEDIAIEAPLRRTVIYSPEQIELYIKTAIESGWKSVAVMAHVFYSIAQSPVDVRTMKVGAYDKRCIHNTRIKTGVTHAPIPLFPKAKKSLDAYLKGRGALHPNAPMFVCESTGELWTENYLQRIHREIRKKAGLPVELQLQDFRRTAQTEAGAAGGTLDEIKALARHTTRDAGDYYIMPDARITENIQEKRLALQNKTGKKVRMDRNKSQNAFRKPLKNQATP